MKYLVDLAFVDIKVGSSGYPSVQQGSHSNSNSPPGTKDIPRDGVFPQNFGYYVLLTELPTYLANILHFDIKSNSLYSAAPYLCCWVVAVVTPVVTDFIISREFLSKTVARKIANTVATMGPGKYC